VGVLVRMDKCKSCGKIKKQTFTCKRCSKKVCLNCFDFVKNQCVDCDVLEYNEKYISEINIYELDRLMEDHQIAG
jgi:hypothetical protein